MSNGVFITGTDTEVGKTIVTAGVLRYLRNEGVDAISMKPVQTGAIPARNGLIAPDLTFHREAAGLDAGDGDAGLMAPFLYEPACSPHLAGRMADRYPDVGHIRQCADALLEKHDFLLVEGAGGIYAPLDETTTMLDMMRALAFPVILVAHRGLGTINHSLLSIDALRAAGLELAGIVFNEIQDVPPDFIKKDNPQTVEQFSKTTVLGNVDFLNELGAHPARAWERFEACMPGLKDILAIARSS